MILIGLGANVASDRAGPPLATCRAALDELAAGAVGGSANIDRGIEVAACSPWYASRPEPVSDQPWYVNGVARLVTDLAPEPLLARLLEVEELFGRTRSTSNAARTLDLDLLAHGDAVLTGALELPHPRLHERLFVLAPLADLVPDWRHPALGLTAAEMLAHCPPGQFAEQLAGP